MSDRQGSAAPDESLEDLWWRAGSEEIGDEEALELLALDVSEVTMALALNGALSPLALKAIFARGGAPADAVTTNRNSPPELKGLAPIGSHSDESVWRFAKDLKATNRQMRALLDELHRSPRPGGPLLEDVWREIVSRHPSS